EDVIRDRNVTGVQTCALPIYKKYYRHSGYPGGLKERSANEMRNNYSKRMIEQAVKGMLPKGPLGRKMQKKLHVYAGEHHRNNAQIGRASCREEEETNAREGEL